VRVKAVSPQHISRLGPVERTRLAAEILAAYARVRWLLHSRTPTDAVAALRRRTRQETAGGDSNMNLLLGWRLAHAVNVTLGPLPTDVRCLFRSLTLLTIMERRSLRPTLIIGVRPRPFAAHAWIELDGQPLLPGADLDHDRLAEI
jgi:Transglutaminase-like superfamily